MGATLAPPATHEDMHAALDRWVVDVSPQAVAASIARLSHWGRVAAPSTGGWRAP